MKTLFKIFAGLAVLLLIVLVIGIFNLDKGIKAVIETVGPELTKSTVTLNDVDLSLTSGEGRLTGLVIGNPSGFKTPHAFSLGEVFLAVDPESVTTDTIVINSIQIVAPQITYESANGVTNLQKLQQNVEQSTGSGGSGSTSANDSDSAPAKNLIIKSLSITDGQLSYSNALLGAEPISLALPPIQLTGIGESSGGVSSAEVVKQILAAINQNAAGVVANSGALKDVGDQIKERAKEKLDGLKGLLGR